MGKDRQLTFQTLIQQHRKILYKVCRAYGRAPQDREDLAQDIVAQLWRSFGSFDDSMPFPAWMYRVALNVAISAHRADTMRRRHFVSDDDQLLSAPDESTVGSNDVQALYEMIARLDVMTRSLMLLYLDGYGPAEIAQILGISETNASTRISRAKSRMRNQFQLAANA